MTGKDKHRKSKLTGFLRYSGNKMSDKERNAFEKELQKDPFAEDAAEGFDSISPNEASKDLAHLQKRLKKRTARRQSFKFYRIAASVAVLMLISTVYIIVERNRTRNYPAETARQTEPLEIAENKPITEPAVKDKVSEKPLVIAEKKADKYADRQIRTEISESEVKAESEKIVVAPIPDSIPEFKVKTEEAYVSSRQAAAPLSVMANEKSTSGIRVKGQVISSEDNMPVPGANIFIKGTNKGVVTDATGNFNITIPDSDRRTLVANFIGMESKEFDAKPDVQLRVMLDPSVTALSEVVVTGYGSVRTDSKKEEELTGYIPPQPVIGKSNFDKYIEKNLRRPDTTTSGQRVVVVVSFTVRTNGSIDSVRIVRSPDKQFSAEAVRLIKSGPSWKPAENNGKPVEDDVRVRIVFR